MVLGVICLLLTIISHLSIAYLFFAAPPKQSVVISLAAFGVLGPDTLFFFSWALTAIQKEGYLSVHVLTFSILRLDKINPRKRKYRLLFGILKVSGFQNVGSAFHLICFASPNVFLSQGQWYTGLLWND